MRLIFCILRHWAIDFDICWAAQVYKEQRPFPLDRALFLEATVFPAFEQPLAVPQKALVLHLQTAHVGHDASAPLLSTKRNLRL